MGYRSTFCTTDHGNYWPQWFYDKYKETVHFNMREKFVNGEWTKEMFPMGNISAINEMKMYGAWIDLVNDIKRALTELPSHPDFFMTVLHEDGLGDKYTFYWNGAQYEVQSNHI